jgi:hypothetical protein
MFEVTIAISNIKIFIRAVAVKKRSTDSHLHDVLTKTFQKINGTSHACIFTKSNQSIIIGISDFLVVNEANIAFKNGLQCRHILNLSLYQHIFTLIV